MPKYKKVFLITEFGTPFSWTDKYIEQCAKNGADCWYWKIFTPNKYDNLPDNVEIVDMTAEQYADLVEKKLGVKPNLFVNERGIPSVHVTDFYVFSGVVFEDYIKDFDFWGITNLDVVYGMLSHFLPDGALEDTDVFTDDVNTINGVFCLFKNVPEINNLFRSMIGWEKIITQEPCKGCIGEGKHTLYGSDEYIMTELLKKLNLRYHYPMYYPIHSHDRLEQHVPDIKLSLKPDGSLFELFKDTKDIEWEHKRPFIGREILYFHFSTTKTWPNLMN